MKQKWCHDCGENSIRVKNFKTFRVMSPLYKIDQLYICDKCYEEYMKNDMTNDEIKDYLQEEYTNGFKM